ncbi:hypothetical protein LCGC14_2831770, partial [marine sediment metagenome]
VVKNAVLYYRDGQYSVPCILLDHSEAGAKIRIDNLSECPPMDDLHSLLTSDTSHPCRCVWTNRNELGIEYIEGDTSHA